MKYILILSIMCCASLMTAQVNWESILEQKSARSFAATVYGTNGTDVDMNTCVDINGIPTTFLAGAIEKRALGIVDFILRTGKADLSLICNDMTILQYGIQYGDAQLVQDLLKAGADPTQKSLSGKTAMEYAMDMDKPVIIGYLKSLQR